MSTNLSVKALDEPVIAPRNKTWRQDLRTIRILRMAVGATVAMAIAQAFNWPFSYATPALVVAMLLVPSPPLTYGETLKNILYAICAFSFGLVVTLFLLPFPLIFCLAYGLIFFFVHYFLHKGAPFFLILMLVLTTTILPLAGSVDEGASNIVAVSLIWGASVAVVIVQLIYGIFPDPPDAEKVAPTSFQPGYSPDAAAIALQTSLIITPAMIAFLIFGWEFHVVAMLYINLVALEGGLAHSKHHAEQYLVANLCGGLSAAVFYCLIVALPAYHFFVALMFLAALGFSTRAYSDSPSARYFPTALIGFMIIISSSTGAGADVTVVFFKRVLYITLASLYVFAATLVLERYGFKVPGGDH